MGDVERVILHLDMDAFFAAVEVRENPSLAGKALIIGHRGRRGVVSTCSYEARAFGVHSAQPISQAYRCCPQGIFVRGRMGVYSAESKKIFSILEAFTPIVEPRLSNTSYTGYSTTSWYLLADPTLADNITVAFLNGRQTPTLERFDAGADRMGVIFRVYIDFGAKAAEYRGMSLNQA